MEMDEGSFDIDDSRLQIKKLKEKVKSLVSEVDLSREIRSDEFSKTSKLQLESNVNDISSELDLSDEDSDEFLDIKEAEFVNEANWLLDRNSNCQSNVESSHDIFNTLYSEVDQYHADISDLYCELQLLRNSSSSSVESNRSNNRTALIDSRTFTRPKKYTSRPPLTSIVSNSGDDGRQGRLQRRHTATISPTPSIINKLEDLSKTNNRPVSGVNRDNNWEEGSEEGLADIENSSRKSNRKSLPASIINRLQELKKSNCSYVSSRTPERNRHINVINGNNEDSERMKVSEDANKVKAAFDLNVKNALSSSCMSDIFKNIPEYFSDDNESFFSLDDVSGFCDRLTLSTDPNTYSSIVREMEQNEICFYHSGTSLEEAPLSRMTFGGREIPMGNDVKMEEITSSNERLLELDDGLNKTYEVLYESAPKANATFDVKTGESKTESQIINTTYDAEKKQSLVDVIMQSEIIKNLSPNYNYRNCDNKNINRSSGDFIVNNANDNFNETYTQNELNKRHSEKYTTKIFDASYRKSSPLEKHNGKKDSDHSEDDCMSTTSDNSYRSVDSNSELKNIEELKNIALQQNKKLSDVKFSTPKLDNSKPVPRNSDEWRNVSPIRKEPGDVESQGSSNASSRGPSPRGIPFASASDTSRKPRLFSVKPPPKVPQRELKLKSALVRPMQNFKKPVNSGRTSAESVIPQKNECKPSASTAGIPVIKPSITPLTTVSSVPNTKPATRIPSGIPRPPSRLKQPQIRAAEVYKK